MTNLWQYSQTSGGIKLNSEEPRKPFGYSGFGPGRNNSAMEAVHDIGPIPKGRYQIGKAYDHPHLGPCTMDLTPIGHNALGRTVFRIHGNNPTNDASHGCIIQDHDIRVAIDKSTDKELWVTE